MEYKKHLFISFLSTTLLSCNLLNASEDTNIAKSKESIFL